MVVDDVPDALVPDARLRDEHERMHQVFDHLLDPTVVAVAERDDAGVIVDLLMVVGNRPAREQGLIGRHLREIAAARGVDLVAAYGRVVETGEPLVMDGLRLPSGSGLQIVDLRVVRLRPEEVLITWRDSTDRTAVQVALAQSEARFRAAFDEAPVAMAVLGLEEPGGRWIMVNEQLARVLGHPREALVGLAVSAVTHPDEQEEERRQFADLAAGRSTRAQLEKRMRRADGTDIWVLRTVQAIHLPGGAVHAVSHLEDITARRSSEAALRHRALYDPLTDLINREEMMERLRAALAEPLTGDRCVALLFVDLDRFKDVNDTLGHEAGDEVLREVAHRLTVTAGADGTPARLAGDEFGLVARLPDPAAAHALAQRVYAAVSAPLVVQGRELRPTASIGVASSTRTHPTGAEDLLRHADLAMYHAKRHGPRAWEVYDETLHDRTLHRLAVEEQVRSALEHDWLRLLYQPVVDLPSGSVVGAEALVRIDHPELGRLSPAAFIDVAEESDLVVELGTWVLEEACAQLARWQRRWPWVQVSVNVSARQAQRLAVSGQVRRALEHSGATPANLVLEITEHALLEAGDLVSAELTAVTDQGCALSIDDFGTGYSSLTHLKRFPVTGVKIDRSFVDGLGTNPDDTAIVTAVTSLAGSLGLGVVAEGVETEGQRAALVALGCTRAQGYLFGRPMTGEALEAMLPDTSWWGARR